MIPSRPWSFSFADGSGNGYRIWADEHDDVRFEYTPVTPMLSSSGVYSGGARVHGVLEDGDASAIWESLLALEKNSSCHVTQRMMGSGSFRYETPEEQGAFLVGAGSELQAFLELVADLKRGG